MSNDFELIGGEEHREIKIVAYDSSWSKRFEQERAKIIAALQEKALRIDHIGSTSVKDMPAKPIIDIQLSVIDPDDESAFVPALEAQDYVLREREKGHRMLRTTELDVHIHVCETASVWERRHLLFRDWLRTNKPDFDAYRTLKTELATQDWKTMNHYADAKGDLIQAITKRAEEWAVSTNWQP